MSASTPQGSWSVVNPFLLTYEVKELADWFEAVATHTQTENEIGFTEPNLSFDLITHEGGAEYLRVNFAIECLPPWADRSGQRMEEVYIDFPLSEVDLHAAARSLTAQLALYPQRTAY